jgi:hypothetical protein
VTRLVRAALAPVTWTQPFLWIELLRVAACQDFECAPGMALHVDVANCVLVPELVGGDEAGDPHLVYEVSVLEIGRPWLVRS